MKRYVYPAASGSPSNRAIFQVNESKPPTELIDLETNEQDELYRLCQDAYEKSYDRLAKSKLYTHAH